MKRFDNVDDLAQFIEGNIIEEKKHQIGKLVRDKARQLYLGYVGKSTGPVADSIQYEVTEDGVRIFTENKIAYFFEYGTDPHKIRPKDAESLAFRAQETVIRQDGTKLKTGDWVFTQEVDHPGTEAKPFMKQALFLSEDDIFDIIES